MYGVQHFSVIKINISQQFKREATLMIVINVVSLQKVKIVKTLMV